MKRTHVALWLVIVVLFVGCEGSLTQPDPFNPQEVELLDQSLAKEAVIVAKLASILPEGTVYTLPEDTTKVQTATGGEELPSGASVENLKGSFYKVHLYSEMKVGLDGLSTVTIDYPSEVQYLNAEDKWIKLSSSGTVSAKTVYVGVDGSGILTVNTLIDVEEADEGIGNTG